MKKLKKFLKRLVKVVGVAVIVVAVALGAGLAVLQHLYPPARLASIVVDNVRTKLHRDARLRHAAIGIWGVSVDGIEIARTSTFKSGMMASASFVRVRLSLLALLQGKIEVKDLLLRDWECRITRHRDGSWDFETPKPESSIEAPAPAEKSETPEGGSSARAGAPGLETNWEVGRLRIENGTVHYLDESRPESALTIHDIQLVAHRLRPKGDFPLELAAVYSGRDLLGSVQLSSVADLGDFSPAAMNVRWSSLQLRHQGLRVESSGDVRDFSAPDLNFEVSVPRQRLSSADAAHWPTQLPLLIPIQARGELSKKDDRIDLRDAKVVWNSIKIEIAGNAQLQKKGPPDLHLRVKTGLFSLADMAGLLPVAQKVGPKGQGDLDVRADGPADAPALAGKVSLKGVTLMVQGQDIRGLNAEANFTPRLVTVKAQGALNRGKFDMQAELKNYRKAPDLRLFGKLSELDLGALLQAQAAAQPTSPPESKPSPQAPKSETAPAKPAPATEVSVHTAGQITIGKITHPNFNSTDNQLQWDLKDANDMSRITGTVKVHVGPGRFDDLENMTHHGLVKALFLPVTMLKRGIGGIHLFPKLTRFNFSEITGDYSFQRGVMTIVESHMDSKDTGHMIATGTANLANETLDMHMSTRLIGVVPGIAAPVGFKVTGTFADPSIKPDYATIFKQPEVKKAVNKLFDNIFR